MAIEAKNTQSRKTEAVKIDKKSDLLARKRREIIKEKAIEVRSAYKRKKEHRTTDFIIKQ